MNSFVYQTKFKMETVTSVMVFHQGEQLISSRDWRYKYSRIPIYQSFWKFLRFA